MKTNFKAKASKDNRAYFNLIALLFITGYLLIDFLPSFKTIERTSPQYLYLAIFNIIIGIYCYYNPGILLGNMMSLFIKNNASKIYVVFLILCGLSILTAANVSVAIVSFTQLLIVFVTFINVTILLYNRSEILFKVFFMVGISVFIQSALVLFDFSKTLNLSAVKGNSGNINILAASLNIKIPFLILGIIHFSNWKRIFLSLVLLLSTAIVLLTSSRTAFLGLVFQMVIFLVFYAKIYGVKKSDCLKIAYLLIPILISFVAVNMIFKKVGDSERYHSIGSRMKQIELTADPKDGSAKLRLNFWDNAVKIISKNPLLGMGIGNWKIESLPYENTLINNADISSNTHNDFLEIAAETGIVNGLLYVVLFAFVFFINIKKILTSNEKQVKTIAVLCLMLWSTYCLDALLNFPFHIPTMQLGFCFLLALTLINCSSSDGFESRFSNSMILLFTIVMSAVSSYFAFSQVKAAQLEYKFRIYQAAYRVNNALPSKKYLLESKDIIKNLPKFPTVSHYAEPFVEYAGVSLYYEKNYKEAMKYFILAQKINPYLGNSDWYIYKMEFLNGNIDKAYEYAKIAFYKRPRNNDFYLSALFMANEKKDTLEMLKIHNEYTQYVKKPGNWINTSNALRASGYSNKELVSFIDEGLEVFPNDTILLARKSLFKHTSRDKYIKIAELYGKEKNYYEAAVYYKKALNEDPENVKVIQNLGICYFKRNDFKTAMIYLSRIKDKPELKDGKTEYLLGACYIAINNKEQGCRYLHLSKHKNFSAAEQLIQQFCK